MILSGGVLIYWTFKHGAKGNASAGIATGIGGLPVFGPGGFPIVTLPGSIPIVGGKTV